MVITRFFLVLGLGIFYSLVALAAEPSFTEVPKVTESYAINPYEGVGVGNILPKEYRELNCRRVELGGFLRDPGLSVLNKELLPIESASLAYLNKVKVTSSTGDIQAIGQLSSFITEFRREEVLKELKQLQEFLQDHDQLVFFRAKEEGNLGVSLFIAQNKEEPFIFKSSFVALLKEGDEWMPCLTPSSFANTNMAYDGELRDQAVALEVWARGELGKYVETIEKKKRADAENKFLALRKGLKDADARLLLDKLAQGLADRDPVQIASVLHLRGGVSEVDEGMRRRQQQSVGLLTCLSDPRSIVVPLDPAPFILSKEQAKSGGKEEAVVFRGAFPSMRSKNGETGDDCAFGVILPRFNAKSPGSEEIEPRYLYYLPLYFSSAEAVHQKGIPENHLLGPADRDSSPFLGFAPEVFSYNAVLGEWSVRAFDDPTMIQRMARDFHRLYPVFQFQNAEDAAKFILAALVAGRYTDLLRCLPIENFRGDLLMQYVKELDALSDQTDILKDSEKSQRLWNQLRYRNAAEFQSLRLQRQEAAPPPIENVVLYEGREDAVLCWKQVDSELDRSRFSSFNLRKQGGFWYLYLPSDPMLVPQGGLSKIAKQLEIYYAAQQLHEACQKVPVLKEVEKLTNISKGSLFADFIRTLIHEKNFGELLKYCLVLEDTPESRKRMVEALIEQVLEYGCKNVKSRISTKSVQENSAFLTMSTYLLAPTMIKEKLRLVEVPSLFFSQQGDQLYWVPELTLLNGLTPKSKELTEKRLALAEKFLSANVYRILVTFYNCLKKDIVATREMKDYEVDAGKEEEKTLEK